MLETRLGARDRRRAGVARDNLDRQRTEQRFGLGLERVHAEVEGLAPEVADDVRGHVRRAGETTEMADDELDHVRVAVREVDLAVRLEPLGREHVLEHRARRDRARVDGEDAILADDPCQTRVEAAGAVAAGALEAHLRHLCA